mgnify:CR=1 FL=1
MSSRAVAEEMSVAGGLRRDAVHSQVAAALHAVVHLRRDRDGQRRVESISAFGRGADGTVAVVPALRSSAHDVATGPGLDLLHRHRSGSRSWP